MNREFLVDVRNDGAHILLVGDLDVATVPAVTRAIERAAKMPVTVIVVDLDDVTFIDSRALGALVQGRQRAIDAGRGYRISPSTEPVVARVLAITGLDAALDADPPPNHGQAIA